MVKVAVKNYSPEWRLCRFLRGGCRDVLFACGGSTESGAARAILWMKCDFNDEPMAAIRSLAPKDILHCMLLSKRLLPILAESSFDVLKVFEKTNIIVAS